MSKLLDSLTGYFFPGDGGAATALAEPPDHAPMPMRTRDDNDLPGLGDAREPHASRDGQRLRDRLRRRSAAAVRREVDGAAVRPWGDDGVRSPRVSPLAHVDPKADLAPDVEVGPFCVVGPNVTIGPGTRLMPHATVLGHTTLGSDNTLHPFCVVGGDPQDKKFDGEPTRLVVGDNNQVREHATIHTGTAAGGGVTRIGDDNLIMVGAHVGHDAIIGDSCVIGNNVMLAGHVRLGDRVSMMGGAAAHHFVTIGDYAFIGGYAHVHIDVPPYVKVDGEDQVRAVNSIGLRRGGRVDEADIAALEVAVRRLFVAKKQPVATTIREMLADPQLNPRVREVVDTIRRRALGKHGRYLEGDRKA